MHTVTVVLNTLRRITTSAIVLVLLGIAATCPATSDNWSAGGMATGAIADVAYTSDGKDITGVQISHFSRSATIFRYNRATGTTEELLTCSPENVRPVLSANGEFAAFHEPGNTIAVWSLRQNTPLVRISIPEFITDLASMRFAANGSSLVVIRKKQEEYCVERYNIYTGVLESSFPLSPAFPPGAYNRTLSDDGEVAWQTTRDSKSTTHVEFWLTATGEHSYYPITTLNEFADVSGTVFLTRKWNLTQVRDIRTGEVVAKFANLPSRIFLSHNGKYLLAFRTDYSSTLIEVYDVATQELLHSFTGGIIDPTGDDITGILSHDLSSIAIISNLRTNCNTSDAPQTYSALADYRLPDGTLINTYPSEGHIGKITSIAVSPEGTIAATSGLDRQTILYDLTERRVTLRVPGNGALAFSPDGSSLLRATSDAIEVLSPNTLHIERRVSKTDGEIYELVWSPDGTRLLLRSGRGIAVYSYPDLQQIFALGTEKDTVAAAQYSRDGNSIVLLLPRVENSMNRLSIRTVSAGDGTDISVNTVDIQYVSSLVLSPDASMFATSSLGRKLCRTTDGSMIRELQYIGREVFTPEGTLISIGRFGLSSTPPVFYHGFLSMSVDNPADDYQCDSYIYARSEAGPVSLAPSGDQLLYTSASTCEMGTLRIVSLRGSPTTLATTNRRAAELKTIYAGTIANTRFNLSPATPLPISIRHTEVRASDPDAISISYNRPVSDTLRYSAKTELVVEYAPLYVQSSDTVELRVVVQAHEIFDTLSLFIIGRVVGPQSVLSTGEVDFGAVPVGVRTADTVRIWSDNPARLYITSVAIEDRDNSQSAAFGIPTALPALLREGRTFDIALSYMPLTQDSLRADLVLETNDPARPQIRIPLRGKGISTVGVAESPSLPGSVHILPQPASSVVHIHYTTSTPGPVQIELFSTEGRLVATTSVNPLHAGVHSEPLSVESLPAGVYYCRVTTPSGVVTKHVVVRR